LGQVFDGHLEAIRPALLGALETDKDTLAAVSPAGHLSALGVPVLLLHGTEDTVIPPEESLWLAHELPPAQLKDVLLSPLRSAAIDPLHGRAPGPG
jgi:pimeloyl-ACP methyl ester carboxylesterase